MSRDILNIHLELLDKKRQEALQRLILLNLGFVLGGGTALALQLAHRKSFDLDFFSPSPLQKNLLVKLSKELAVENVAVDTSDELTFFAEDTIKITFLYYPFKSLFKHVEVTKGLRVFPVKEIALQKAYAIGRRGEYRDYFDLYTILSHGYIGLKELINGARQIYNGAFDEKLFLEQLVYYGDLRNFEIIPVDKNPQPTPDEIKQYFEDLVKAYIS